MSDDRGAITTRSSRSGDLAMRLVERLIAATALFVAAHFCMGYIVPAAGGRGGAPIFPFASDVPTRWLFGGLDGMLALLVPIMIGLAGIAVLAFFLAFLATFGLWVRADLWRPLVLVGAACSATVLLLHPSVWIVLPIALDAGLA